MNMIKEIAASTAFIHVDVDGWAAYKRLKIDDLDLPDMPPETLVSLGSKKIFDPKLLKWVKRLRTRVRNRCLEIGTRFAGGFLVPLEGLDDLLRDIEEDKAEWDRELSSFLASYKENLDAFLLEAGPWRHILEDAVLSKDEVAGKFWWSTPVLKVEALATQAAHDTLAPAMNDLGRSLLHEVAQWGKVLYDTSVLPAVMAEEEDARCVTQRAVSTLRRMMKKLRGLSFLHPKAILVHDMICRVVEKLPQKGKIKGNDLGAVAAVLLQIVDADKNGIDSLVAVGPAVPEESEAVVLEETTEEDHPEIPEIPETGPAPEVEAPTTEQSKPQPMPDVSVPKIQEGPALDLFF